MFSFVDDNVLDPFCGTGTTMLAAMRTERNSIGVDIDPHYIDLAERRLLSETQGLFPTCRLEVIRSIDYNHKSQYAAR
jgi:site-specific DNA-methyltransferase (adenine-specific)